MVGSITRISSFSTPRLCLVVVVKFLWWKVGKWLVAQNFSLQIFYCENFVWVSVTPNVFLPITLYTHVDAHVVQLCLSSFSVFLFPNPFPKSKLYVPIFFICFVVLVFRRAAFTFLTCPLSTSFLHKIELSICKIDISKHSIFAEQLFNA